MPQYLYRIAPTRPTMLTEGLTPEEERVISDHFAYLEAGVAEGVVLLAGRTLNTDASTFGIVILRAATEAEARRRMEADPAVQRGVMSAALFPFRVALAGTID
jgi:uncharacterized protein YciI